MMRTIYAAGFALAWLFGASAAMADSTTGTVEKVDQNSRTVVINGQPYMLEGQASGLKISEIKVGEKVTIEYDTNTNNVSQINQAK